MIFLVADGLLAIADGLRAVANVVEGVALNLEAHRVNGWFDEVDPGFPFEDYELTEWGWVNRV